MHFSKRTVTWIPLKSPYQKPIQQSCKLLPTCILHFYMLSRQFHSRPPLKILPDTIEILPSSLGLSKLEILEFRKDRLTKAKEVYLSIDNILLKWNYFFLLFFTILELHFFQNLGTFQNYYSNRVIYFQVLFAKWKFKIYS